MKAIGKDIITEMKYLRFMTMLAQEQTDTNQTQELELGEYSEVLRWEQETKLSGFYDEE